MSFLKWRSLKTVTARFHGMHKGAPTWSKARTQKKEREIYKIVIQITNSKTLKLNNKVLNGKLLKGYVNNPITATSLNILFTSKDTKSSKNTK